MVAVNCQEENAQIVVYAKAEIVTVYVGKDSFWLREGLWSSMGFAFSSGGPNDRMGLLTR